MTVINDDNANIFSLFFQNIYEFISKLIIGLNTKKIIHITDIILITTSNLVASIKIFMSDNT